MPPKKKTPALAMNRRQFLKLMGLSGLSAFVAGCGQIVSKTLTPTVTQILSPTAILPTATQVPTITSAYQAMAAVLGGTQSLHTNSMDETLALPSEKAALLAVRTQQIIMYETGVPNTIDPLAGSYYVEALTDKIEAEAEAYFDEIERRGGVLKGIEDGYFQREIAKSAYRYQKEIERKERIIVGVNDYVMDEHITIPVLKIDEAMARDQIASLHKVKASRDNDKVKRTLADLTTAAKGNGNTMKAILDCVRVYATEGEIVDALRPVFGEYTEPPMF